MDRLAEPEPLARLIAGVPRRAEMALSARDEPDESRASLGVAQSLGRPTTSAWSGWGSSRAQRHAGSA
jgi:hypothetical protein